MYIHLKSTDETSYKSKFTLMVSFQRTRKFGIVLLIFQYAFRHVSRFKIVFKVQNGKNFFLEAESPCWGTNCLLWMRREYSIVAIPFSKAFLELVFVIIKLAFCVFCTYDQNCFFTWVSWELYNSAFYCFQTIVVLHHFLFFAYY